MSTNLAPVLFKPLTKRPAATTVTVRELLKKVQDGEIRIPKFQRPLRWTGEHVVQLLDSIWRGYPIGSLLFWKKSADQDTIQVGNTHFNAPAVSDAWWVVDGQQRTTALAASLLNLDQAGDSRWIVRFDPDQQEFHSGPPAPERTGIDVPLSVLGDLRRLGRWIRECSLPEEQIAIVEEAQQRLLDYALPAYIVDTNDEQALRGVFARLNSTGARMRADEVFQALLGAPTSAGRSSLDLDALQQGCNIDGFGQPPRAEILKAILAMSGRDPSRRLDDLKAKEGLNLVSPEDAAEALSRTVEFLVNDCHVPHVSLIPYPVIFFILARWFHIHPGTEPLTRALLARWVWRGAATGAHHRGEVSRMREQVRDIQPDDEQQSLDRMLARVKTQPRSPWQLRRFNLKSAHSRIEVLALLAQQPADQYGPIRVAELVSGGRIAREIFPASDWENLSLDAQDLARTAANRILLGSSHTGLRRELRQWDWNGYQSQLQSHLVDEESYYLLKDSLVEEFLTHRGEAVRASVEDFLEKRAAWNEPNLRPLSHYCESIEANR